MAEIIGADFNIPGRNIAEMTILGLIIDDGVKDRGHRKTIYNPEYKYIGCSTAIQGEKVITVFNMTENNLQKINGNGNMENENLKCSKYAKSADTWSASVPFQDSTNFKNMTSGFGNQKSSNDDHSFMKRTSQSKKMTEKREN